MTAESARVRLQRTGRIARILLDRPPLNVLDIPAILQLREALSTVLAENEPDLIILAGAGDRGFSAGVDIKDHTPERVERMLSGFHAVFRALASCDRISIAAVRGVCLGGGFELAACCDFVICEESARLGLPEIDVGCFPPVAAAAFSDLVGAKRAAEWILTGRPVTPREAHAAGLVTRLVPDGDLDWSVDELAGTLLAKSSAVLRTTVRALRGARSPTFSAALERAERLYVDELLKTEDIHEGIASFIEKRKPSWKHR